jgi:hypothetical protein
MMNQSHTFSTNGLHSYIDASPEYELAPIGIASMRDQVQRLAEFGRNGDIYVIHAAEGETVIPMEVLEANPQIKALLFNQMAEMGLDPQRYVVGDQLNSLNPVTGMPEFFISGIFKGIKKAFKAVWKVVKKIAPIALPLIAATFGFPFLGPLFLPGSIGSMALGSGIGTLLGGGSIKDAFKSALISGASAGIFGGLKGAWNAPKGEAFSGFTAGVKAAAYPGAAAAAQTAATTAATAIPTDVGSIAGPYIPSYQAGFQGGPSGSVGAFGQGAPASLSVAAPVAVPIVGSVGGPGGSSGAYNQVAAPAVAPAVMASADPRAMSFAGGSDQVSLAGGVWRPGDPSPDALLDPAPSWLDTAKDYSTTVGDFAFRGGRSAKDITAAGIELGEAYIADTPAFARTAAGYEAAVASAQPGMLARWGPTAATVGAVAYGMGAFDPVKEDEVTLEDIPSLGDQRLTTAEREAAAAEYRLASVDPYQFTPDPNVLQPSLYGAAGGSVNYPERDLLVQGPGTERSDDIPAMLSDGEFVINSRAVRGADPSGRGNRYAGAQNLYSLMRNFEMRA